MPSAKLPQAGERPRTNFVWVWGEVWGSVLKDGTIFAKVVSAPGSATHEAPTAKGSISVDAC